MFTRNLLILLGIIILTILIINKGKYKKFKEGFTEREDNELDDIKKDIEFLKKQIQDINEFKKNLDRNTKDLCDIKKKLNKLVKEASKGTKGSIDLPFKDLSMC